jgi:hypothetical protein
VGHYDEQREFYCYQQDLRKDQKLIEDVQGGRFDVLLDAAYLNNSNTVVVNKDAFSRMLTIIARLDAKTYTYPFQP